MTVLKGTSLANKLFGGNLADTLYGFAGNDTLTGNAGDSLAFAVADNWHKGSTTGGYDIYQARTASVFVAVDRAISPVTT